jgi:hypothetical protein
LRDALIHDRHNRHTLTNQRLTGVPIGALLEIPTANLIAEPKPAARRPRSAGLPR